MYSLRELLFWCLMSAIASPVVCCGVCGVWRLCRERFDDWLYRGIGGHS
jgi:hypothetical protein